MEEEARTETTCLTVIILTDLRKPQLIWCTLLEQDRSFRPDDELSVFQETLQQYWTELLQQRILLVDGGIVRVFADVLAAGFARAYLARPVGAHVERATLALLISTHHERYRDNDLVFFTSLDERAVLFNKQQGTPSTCY